MSSIQNTLCTKDKVMLACRRKNSDTITLLAWAYRDDVFFKTGDSWTRTHNAQGSSWYFCNGYCDDQRYGYQGAWGFSKQGDSIYRRGYCDSYTSGTNDKRLCVNTFSVCMPTYAIYGYYIEVIPLKDNMY